MLAVVGNCTLSWVPTADQINSIKPVQAIGYWSGSVGMSDRGRSVKYKIELIVKQSSGDRIDIFYTICTRSARPLPEFTRLLPYGYSTVHDHVPIAIRQEVEKKSCIPVLVELGRVWSGNFNDRDDRVDRIGSGNPPEKIRRRIYACAII
ncbi:hypothetical protein DPMN_122369 [Dreissena polymorpha]|uniref:Uncharacterized protein n=1 Tax=Dreissena polymorpha TaxID=45954 RepID=A0A9D4JU39_DREPO|nr:hypothetical protein DPMN_122369 [Dreissena polymorpha]